MGGLRGQNDNRLNKMVSKAHGNCAIVCGSSSIQSELSAAAPKLQYG